MKTLDITVKCCLPDSMTPKEANVHAN